ncbi:MAG: peptidoglycan DD-metalloendopeptidase family protein, partial [Fimbriimonadaceae bacterium]|nr:peptidoglycan DD-metalloendopeptidase family protein [Chitinophagales bacterium]
ADGEVIYIEDGYFDRNCGSGTHTLGDEADFNGGYYGNFVALRHDDWSITVYAHLKEGTVAALEDGDEVVTGQFLGKLGSSGNSSGPHLHFEVRPCEGCTYIEPWFDTEGCNDDVTESQWIDQIPYTEPQLIRVTTHDELPEFKDCVDYESGSNENVNFSNHFNVGANLYIGVSMRDFLVGDGLDIDIFNSAGVVQESFDYVALADYEKVTFTFTENLLFYSTGTYRVRVIHDGKTYDHYFTVNCPAALTLSGAQSGHKGYISGDNINSTATISGTSSNQILYEAENHIKLNVGFKATANCEFIAQLDDCTIGGLKETEEELVIENDKLNVYPNPNLGMFTIYFKGNVLSKMQVSVRNMMGELIYVSDDFEITDEFSEIIDMQSQPKGIYFVELNHDGIIETQKVVIQ